MNLEIIKTKFNKNVLIHSFRLCVATTLAAIVGEFLNLGHMYWLMFTVVLVMQNEIGSSIKRSAQRLIGTLIGAPIGLILIAAIGDYNVIAMALFTVIIFSAVLLTMPNHYGVAALLMTAAVVIIYAITGDAHTEQTAISRIFDTFLGTIIAVFVSMTIFPISLKKVIEKDWNDFLKLSGDAYEQIMQRYAGMYAQNANQAKPKYVETGVALIKEVSAYSWEPSYIWRRAMLNDDRQQIINNSSRLISKYIEMGSLVKNDINLQEDVKAELIKFAEIIKTAFYALAEDKVVINFEELDKNFKDKISLLIARTREIDDKKEQWKNIVKISAFFEQGKRVLDILGDLTKK